MTFKNKRDESFFKALRTVGLGRKKAFKATILSREFRAESDMRRWGYGMVWSDVDVGIDDGTDILNKLDFTNVAPLPVTP